MDLLGRVCCSLLQDTGYKPRSLLIHISSLLCTVYVHGNEDEHKYMHDRLRLERSLVWQIKYYWLTTREK